MGVVSPGLAQEENWSVQVHSPKTIKRLLWYSNTIYCTLEGCVIIDRPDHHGDPRVGAVAQDAAAHARAGDENGALANHWRGNIFQHLLPGLNMTVSSRSTEGVQPLEAFNVIVKQMTMTIIRWRVALGEMERASHAFSKNFQIMPSYKYVGKSLNKEPLSRTFSLFRPIVDCC